MKTSFLFLLSFSSLLFVSCNESKAPDTPTNDKAGDESQTLSFEERVRRNIESQLKIAPGEKYQLDIHLEHLDSDTIQDAVIVVNRLEMAIQKSVGSQSADTKRKYGYMGNYNYFAIYDGKRDQISRCQIIASSAKAPLQVHFENIQSDLFKNLVITYRIRNSGFRNYYLYENGQLAIMFQWKSFDALGEENYEANFFQYDQGSYSLAKDILIYRGKIGNYQLPIQDIYLFKPMIESTGQLRYRFFYDPKSQKYMTTDQVTGL
ncbi:MAG: hypothetical protein EP338_02860 [Bacteroidetes bacterium]|nr:MAG: hypothetical protein EP338_02860 [Bacteroidota bacterium]